MTKEEVQEDLDVMKALDAVAHSEGGKLLAKSLGSDVVSTVDSLLSKYKTASHMELVTSLAKLQSDLSLLRVLTRAETNKKDAEEALELLAE